MELPAADLGSCPVCYVWKGPNGEIYCACAALFIAAGKKQFKVIRPSRGSFSLWRCAAGTLTMMVWHLAFRVQGGHDVPASAWQGLEPSLKIKWKIECS